MTALVKGSRAKRSRANRLMTGRCPSKSLQLVTAEVPLEVNSTRYYPWPPASGNIPTLGTIYRYSTRKG